MPFPGRWLRRKPPPAPLDLVNHAVAGQIDAIAALGVILSARGLVTREETRDVRRSKQCRLERRWRAKRPAAQMG